MTITLVAAVWKPLQGMLLTAEGLGFFIGAMMLMPKAHAVSSTFWGVGRSPTAPAGTAQSREASGTTERKVKS
jgi:hypothetical protein